MRHIFKKIKPNIIISILLICSFLTMNCICATDIEINDTANDFNSTDDYSFSVEYNNNYNNLVDLLKENNGTIDTNNNSLDPDLISQLKYLGIENNSFILVSGSNFKDLNEKISNARANDIIIFEGNFTQDANGETIHLDKPLRFLGNNNYLNAQNYTKLFTIESDNILFVNLNFVNSQDMELANVNKKYKNLTFIGCQVYNVLDDSTCQYYDFNNEQFYTTHKVDISTYDDRKKLIEDSKTFYDNLIINFKPDCIININSPIYEFIRYNCNNLIINGNGAHIRSKYFGARDLTPGMENGPSKVIITNVNYFLLNKVNTVIYNITLDGFNGAICNKGSLEVNHVIFDNNHAYYANPDYLGDCITNKGILTSVNSTYKNSKGDAVYCYKESLFKSINDTFIKTNEYDIYLDKVAIFKFYELNNINQHLNSLKIKKHDSAYTVTRNTLNDICKNVTINNKDDLKELRKLVRDIPHIDSLNVIINCSLLYIDNNIGVFLKPIVDLTIEGNGAHILVNKPKDNLENHFIANTLTFTCVTINDLYLRGFNTALTNWGELILNNCTFYNNRIEYTTQEDYGGAIRNMGYLLIKDCTFLNNYAKFGGAIFNEGKLIKMGDNVFKNNKAYYDDQSSFKKFFSRLNPKGSSSDIYNSGSIIEFNSTNNTTACIYNEIKNDWTWRVIVFKIVIPIVLIPIGIALSFVPLARGIGYAIAGIGIDIISLSLITYDFSVYLISYLSYKSLGGKVNDADNRYLSQVLPTLIYDGILMTITTVGIMAKIYTIYKFKQISTLVKKVKSNVFKPEDSELQGKTVSRSITGQITEQNRGTTEIETNTKIKEVFSYKEKIQIDRSGELNLNDFHIDKNQFKRDLMTVVDKHIQQRQNLLNLIISNPDIDIDPTVYLKLKNDLKALQSTKSWVSRTTFETVNDFKWVNEKIVPYLLDEMEYLKYNERVLVSLNNEGLKMQTNMNLLSLLNLYRTLDIANFLNLEYTSNINQMSYGEHLDMVIPA